MTTASRARWAQQHYPDPSGAGGASDATAYSLVLRPGDPLGNHDNVFTSWGALYAVASTIQGGVRVLVDDSIATPVPVPAGTYEVDDWTLVGIINTTTSSAAVLDFENGAHLDYHLLFLFNIQVQADPASTSPVVVQTHEGVISADGALIFGSAGAPFLQANVVGLDLLLREGELGDGTNPAVTLAAGTSFTGELYLGATLSANAVGGPGAAAGATYFTDDSVIFQAPLPGTLVIQSVAAPTLTFQPGGSPANNVFTSWATLYFVLNGITGPRTVLIDDSFTSPAVIQAGTYDLDNVTLIGIAKSQANEFAELEFANGAVVTVTEGLTVNRLEVSSISAAPVITSAALTYIESDQSTFAASAASPMFSVPNGDIMVFEQFGGNFGDGTHAVATVAVGGTLVWNGLTSDLEANSVTGPGAAAGATYNYDAGTIVHPPNPAGTYVATDVALFMSYTPAVLANWSGVAPTSVANALDRIAAKVGPIP